MPQLHVAKIQVSPEQPLHSLPCIPCWPTIPEWAAHLLCPAFVSSLILVVNPAEVGNNYRDWQGNDQDATQGADGTEDLPCNGLRHHVSIPERERWGEGERGHLGDSHLPLLPLFLPSHPPSTHLFSYLSIHLPIHSSNYPSTSNHPVHPSIHQPTYPSIYLH